MKDTFAVVFDMDGVIFDSERLVIACWKPIAQKYHIPDIEEACFECMGINAALTEQKMKERYGEQFPYQEYKAEVSKLFFEQAKDGKLPQKEGIKELLEYLKNRQIKIALASSTRREVVERELKEGGLFDYFDQVVCGDMVQNSKPDPEIFLKACEQLGVNPQSVYAIEDSYNGIRSASRAGMMPIMVVDLAPATDEMRKLAIKVYDSLLQVKEYFKQI